MKKFSLKIVSEEVHYLKENEGFKIQDEMPGGSHQNLIIQGPLNFTEFEFVSLVSLVTFYKFSLKNVTIKNVSNLTTNWNLDKVLEPIVQLKSLNLIDCRFNAKLQIKLKKLKQLKISDRPKIEGNFINSSVTKFLEKCPQLEDLTIEGHVVKFSQENSQIKLKKFHLELCSIENFENFEEFLISQKENLNEIRLIKCRSEDGNFDFIFNELKCEKITLEDANIEGNIRVNKYVKEIELKDIKATKNEVRNLIGKLPSE